MRTRNALCLLIAGILAASTWQPTEVFSQSARQERLTFKPGSSSATLSGSIKGSESIEYVLGARRGQTMRVSLKTNNGANSWHS